MKPHAFLRAALLAVPLLAAASGPGSSQAIVSSGQSFINAKLLPGEVQPDGSRMAGLSMTLEPGWKTYWRYPGETGIPPQMDWSGSANIAEVEVLWPRPEIFMSFGYQTVGYSERVVFPLRITPTDPTLPMDLRLEGMIGVCKEVCVLEHLDLAETIAPDHKGARYRQIKRAMRAVPKPAVETGLVRAECRISGAGKDRNFDLNLAFETPLNDPVVLVEGGPGLWVHGVETRAEDGLAEVTAVVTLEQETGWVNRSSFRITVLDGYMAADVQGCTAPS